MSVTDSFFFVLLFSSFLETKIKTHVMPESEFQYLLVVASDWSGKRLDNCAFLSCWVCLDSETKEDYSASSKHPRLEGFAWCVKKPKTSSTSNTVLGCEKEKQCHGRLEDWGLLKISNSSFMPQQLSRCPLIYIDQANDLC